MHSLLGCMSKPWAAGYTTKVCGLHMSGGSISRLYRCQLRAFKSGIPEFQLIRVCLFDLSLPCTWNLQALPGNAHVMTVPAMLGP